jgi:hypothetical protein
MIFLYVKKALLSLVCLALLSTVAFAQGRTKVKSYVKKDGTRVESHERTKANGKKSDNWSTKGNVNPNTGKKGTKNP